MEFEKVNLRGSQFEEAPAHGGIGRVRVARLAERDDLASRCNFIDYAVVPPGASIGDHRHASDEEEFYLVLAGRALLRRGSELIPLAAGDLVRNPPGGLHGLRNDGPDDVELFVFELGV
jgi:mannose-6-phosphate isomerase-like protein (cupin superfamily)